MGRMRPLLSDCNRGCWVSRSRETRWLVCVLGVVLLTLGLLATVPLSGMANELPTNGALEEQPPGNQTTVSTANISHIEHGGLGIIREDVNTTYLFEGEPFWIEVMYETGGDLTNATVCVEVSPEEDSTADDAETDELSPATTCSPARTIENSTHALERLDYDEWGGEWSGETNTTISIISEVDGNETIHDTRTYFLVVLDPDEDLSGSGLSNAEELREGTDFTRADTAQSGLIDGDEVTTYGTDPLARDTSGNGISDGLEVLLGTDPTNPFTPHVFVVAFAVLVAGGFAGAAIYLMPKRLDQVEQVDRPAGQLGNGTFETPTNGATTVVTDRGHVLELLHTNEGQIKQQHIVKETEWSKSKVSRLLAQMEEEGTINRVRIGRENVVMLTNDEETGSNQQEIEL